MKRLLHLLVPLLVIATADAAPVRRFVLDTPRTLSGATGQGVALFPDGSLRPLPPLGAVASFEEPLGLALAVAGDGTAFVGTGHPARIWRVRGGAKEMVAEVDADQITDLLLDPKGTLYVSTALPARLLRLAPGRRELETVATLEEGNLWDLEWFRGELLVAAGNPGRVMRLGAKGLEPAFTVPDAHARTLAVSGDVLLVGTSGKGLVMRWSGDGPAGVLIDSSFTEIAALAASPNGMVFAAAVTGDPTLGRPAPPKDEGGVEATATVTVTEGGGPTATPAAERAGPATSEILRITPTGAVTTVHRFSKQLAGALAWHPNGLVIGTGLEGELWQLVEGAAAQLDDLEAAQVARVANGGEWVLTQGPVQLLRRSGTPRGTLTSPVLDAGQPAQWGEATVRAMLPAGASCRLRFRSGMAAEVGDTWSEWTQPQPCASVTAKAPPARYLQWQLELEAAASARIDRVHIAYRQLNLAPEVRDVTVHAPGEIFLKGPPPSDRVIEVRHPDQSGIFTVLDNGDEERQATLGKRYYRVGYQTVSWRAEDPNGDPLRFSLEVQRAGAEAWWGVRSRLETTVLAIDTQALPDGVYRFRLTASDEPANPESPASASAISSWFTVDNTAPRVSIVRQADAWLVTVEDELSPISVVEWNRDADTWKAAVPADGMIDSRRESFRIPIAQGRHVLAVRAVDDHHNRATAAVEEGL